MSNPDLKKKTELKTIVDFCRRKGFVFQSSEIYGGLSTIYDFGPLGTILKRNLVQAWRDWMITYRTDTTEIEGAIFLHPRVWDASGHTSGFSDLLVEDTVTHKRYRADHLIEDAKVKLPESFLKASFEEYLEIAKKLPKSKTTIVCKNQQNQYLILKRASQDSHGNVWENCGGGIDIELNQANVTAEAGRELFEETGQKVDKLTFLFGRNFINKQAESEGNFYFLAEVDSTDAKLSSEHSEYKWLKTNQALEKLIWPDHKLAIETAQNNIITNAGTLTLEQVDQIIDFYQLKSPEGNPLSKAKKFNLLVKTHLGVNEDTSTEVYLKGESCQNIYVDWKAVQETTRRKLPFGIAQLGKAFRNEITLGQFLFRTREFEQIDMQYFVKPGTEKEYFDYWKQYRYDFYTQFLGFKPDNLKWHQHDQNELVFYASEAWDIYYQFGALGFKEMEGVHNRTDYDTKQHQKFSGQDLTYFDAETNERYLPYIVEMSLGIGRLFLATLYEFYEEEQLENETRVVLRLPTRLAPYKYAILPLMKKGGLSQKATEIYTNLRKRGISCDYDEAGSIGKRYRRQDENGTPGCICIDYVTLEDNTVTIRDRDTMEQKRVKIDEL